MKPNDYLSLAAAQALLAANGIDVDVSTLRAAINTRALRASKLGGRDWRTKPAWLQAWLLDETAHRRDPQKRNWNIALSLDANA